VLVGLLVPEDEAAVDVPLLHLEGHYVHILRRKCSSTHANNRPQEMFLYWKKIGSYSIQNFLT